MKILIAIVTCHRYQDRAAAIRETWVKEIPEALTQFHNDKDFSATYKFFLGRPSGDYTPKEDEIILPVDDGYKGLPEKTRAIHRWAIEQGFDYVYKSDDDAYVVPSRLLWSGFQFHDYIGRLRGASGNFPAPYASGFGYWLSRKAIEITAQGDITGHEDAEDRYVGNVLSAAGIDCHLDDRYVVVKSQRNQASFHEGPRVGNDVIAACEFQPADMRIAHRQWKDGEASHALTQVQLTGKPFSRICVMIKTFLRDGYLINTIAAVRANLPGAKMVIVDDGLACRRKIALYPQLRREGHVCICLPLDSGFGAKANAAIPYLDREYTLIGSDDFDFTCKYVPEGIKRMMAVLDSRGDIAVASGRVDNNPYEGFIERGPGYFKEIRFDPKIHPMEETADGVKYALVDLTVNYNLVRSKILGPGRVTWEGIDKIGGDHFDFYEQVRLRGEKIAWVPGVNINQQRYHPSLQDPQYPQKRARARQAIPRFLARHGIERYIGFDGREDRAI